MKKLILSICAMFIMSITISESASAQSYRVKSGDSLYKIAKKNGVSVNQLKKWNKLKSDMIRVNQVLEVNPAKKVSGVKSANAKKAPAKAKKVLTVRATAYTASCKGCSGITSMGINLKKNPKAKVISVDPKVIPLGSKVHVEGYGYAIAADKGSAIKGNKIDVFIPSLKQARNWGVKKVKIKIID